MPSFSVSTSHHLLDWSISDYIQELKYVVRVKAKQKNINAEHFQKEQDLFKHQIKILRKEISEVRKRVHKALNADEVVIQKGLFDNKRARLSFCRFSAKEAVDIMSKQCLLLERHINELRHIQRMKKRHLAKLSNYIDRLRKCSKITDDEKSQEELIQKTQIAIEELNIKKNAAKIVYEKYKIILENLLKDTTTMRHKLTKMVFYLENQKRNLNDIREIVSAAVTTRDKEYDDLVLLEKETNIKRLRRHRKMKDLQYELTKLSEPKTNDNKQKHDTENRDFSFIHRETVETSVNFNNTESKLHETKIAANNLMRTTKTTDLEDVERRLVSQEIAQRCLLQERKTKEELRESLLRMRDELEAQYLFHKDSLEMSLSRGEKNIWDLACQIDEEENRKAKAKRRANRIGSVLTDVKKVVESILQKLFDIKVEFEFSEDPLDQLLLCDLKVDSLLESIENLLSEDDSCIWREDMSEDSHTQLQTYLIRMNREGNQKISFYRETDTPSNIGFVNESENEEEAPTRDKIKQMSHERVTAARNQNNQRN